MNLGDVDVRHPPLCGRFAKALLGESSPSSIARIGWSGGGPSTRGSVRDVYWLNIAFLIIAGLLVWRFLKMGRPLSSNPLGALAEQGALLALPVLGHSPRLIHRQHREHDQHHQDGTGGGHH